MTSATATGRLPRSSGPAASMGTFARLVQRLRDNVPALLVFAGTLVIWERTGTTILFVTHSIPEAVFLSSRVVVMSARPGRITKVIDVDLPRPRNEDTRETRRYFELVTAVREALRSGGGSLDDAGTVDADPVDADASLERTIAEGPV